MEALHTDQLSKQFGTFKALDNISLNLSAGKIYALVGNNGSGKTTLFRIIMGLSFPSYGSLSLFGCTTARENELARRKIGAIIENPILQTNLSGYQNLNYVRILKGISEKSTVDTALNRLDLGDKKHVSVRHYSMGMKQRLALACALLGDPQMLLLDEPINGLDPIGIREIGTILSEACEQNGTTILISSHYLKQLYGFATNYIFINKGKILETASSDELDKRCNKCVYLSISEKEKNIAVKILTAVLDNKIRLLDNGEICIYGFQNNMTVIENALSKERIKIDSVRTTGINLEDYFIQIVGGIAK